MPTTCSAFGCSSSSRNAYKNSSGLSFHSYPLNNPELLKTWLKNNPRKDFTPTKYSKLCSKHFEEADFTEYSQDSNVRRTKVPTRLKQRCLKPDAVPTLFPEAPRYLRKPKRIRIRKTTATAEGRRALESERLAQLQEDLFLADDLTSLTLREIQVQLENLERPTDFITQVFDDVLVLYVLKIKENVPFISSSISIDQSLSIKICYENEIVSRERYSDLLSSTTLKTFSQILNLMARVKSWVENPQLPKDLIDSAVLKLHAFQSLLENDDPNWVRCSFLIEQLELLLCNKHARIYSPDLIILSYLIFSTSSSTYKLLLEQQVLLLPSESTLKKITRKVDTSTGLNNTSYLKLRQSKLNAIESHCLLMIDEIYIAKRAEYSGGRIQGRTDQSEVAGTLLCFMIKSVAGAYKDIVSMYPMFNLTSKKLLKCYEEVLDLINSIPFNIVAISVDNASANRSFFIELCGGELKTHILNPATNQPIYLLFDPVHNFKNIYNNFQTRKILKCPPIPPLAPKGIHANFHHVKELHQLESSLPLRKAHKLSSKVIDPKSIEKVSVKLAAAVGDDGLTSYTADLGCLSRC